MGVFGFGGGAWGRVLGTEDDEGCDAVGEREEAVEVVFCCGGVLDVGLHVGCEGRLERVWVGGGLLLLGEEAHWGLGG